jgi:hypothetical protein
MLMKRLATQAITPVLVGLLGCMSDDGEPASRDADLPTDGEHELRGPCPPSTQVGGFEVEHSELGYFASGNVADRALLLRTPEEVLESGACRVLKPTNPFCDPPCSGQYCASDGSCAEYPENRNVGSVFIEGLIKPIRMEPVGNDHRYYDSALPSPAFEPGAMLKLSAVGNDVPGFTLHGEGVEPIVVIADQAKEVAEGQDLVLEWEADPERNATIAVRISIDLHGVSPATLVCEGPDTGSMLIAAELVDGLLELGASGFPSAAIERHTIDSVETNDGCIAFKVASSIAVALSVPSHVPCHGAADCPEGATCDLDLQTCI